MRKLKKWQQWIIAILLSCAMGVIGYVGHSITDWMISLAPERAGLIENLGGIFTVIILVYIVVVPMANVCGMRDHDYKDFKNGIGNFISWVCFIAIIMQGSYNIYRGLTAGIMQSVKNFTETITYAKDPTHFMFNLFMWLIAVIFSIVFYLLSLRRRKN